MKSRAKSDLVFISRSLIVFRDIRFVCVHGLKIKLSLKCSVRSLIDHNVLFLSFAMEPSSA